MRYEKTVNGITTRIYLEGDKVIAEEKLNASGMVTSTKYYVYDQTGIAGMVYNGQTYYFLKNLFGDVIAIYNSSGSQVASYTYDVWGNESYTYSSGVGAENPFRYRGYYYDNETGFYYLQSRYYDPEICRFISADNLELLPDLSQVPGQLNLYAYCNNNPVNYTDPSGEILLSTAILIGLGIGAAVGVGVGIGIGLANGASGWELFADAMLGMGLGGLLGAAIGAAIFYAPTIAGGISNFFNSSFAIGSFAMGDQLVAVSVTGAQIAAAAGISAIGLNILFKSDSRPRNNSVQDKQFRDAARKAGVDPKDPKIRDELNLAHMYIRNNHLNLGFKDLVEFIRTWFGLG